MIDCEVLQRLAETLNARKGVKTSSSYVASLYEKGVEAMGKKLVEEAVETVMAAKDGKSLPIVREVADLWFHSMVLLAHFGLGPDDVLAELCRREGISGLDEKRSRDQA